MSPAQPSPAVGFANAYERVFSSILGKAIQFHLLSTSLKPFQVWTLLDTAISPRLITIQFPHLAHQLLEPVGSVCHHAK